MVSEESTSDPESSVTNPCIKVTDLDNTSQQNDESSTTFNLVQQNDESQQCYLKDLENPNLQEIHDKIQSTPNKTIGKAPSNIEKAPSKIEKAPSKIENTPTKIEKVPSKIENSPSKILQKDLEKLSKMIEDSMVSPMTEFEDRMKKVTLKPISTFTKLDIHNDVTENKDEDQISFEDAAKWAASQKRTSK